MSKWLSLKLAWGLVFLEQPAHCSPPRRGQRGGQRRHSQESSNKDEGKPRLCGSASGFTPVVLVVLSLKSFLSSLLHSFLRQVIQY